MKIIIIFAVLQALQQYNNLELFKIQGCQPKMTAQESIVKLSDVQ